LVRDECGNGVDFRMRPEEGARKQIEIYKRMSGKERVRIAFQMWEMALAMTKASERAMHPELSNEEIERRARKRMTGGTA
jgi:ABC-type Na+ transport system ATPase subunit NatA